MILWSGFCWGFIKADSVVVQLKQRCCLIQSDSWSGQNGGRITVETTGNQISFEANFGVVLIITDGCPIGLSETKRMCHNIWYFVLTTGSVVLNMKTQTTSSLKWVCCSAPEVTCMHVLWCFPGFDDFHLSIHSDMATVAKAMACPESGLEVRDRMWLKITIANAFIGMSLKAQDTAEHLLFPSSVCTHSYIPHL